MKEEMVSNDSFKSVHHARNLLLFWALVWTSVLASSQGVSALTQPPSNAEFALTRRGLLRTTIATTVLVTSPSHSARAVANPKSRTDGYKVQHTEREWAYILSGPQYFILRQGGTERQKSSILNTFTAHQNVGTYVCAGCDTPLFASVDKFNSGTGWPSFSSALEGVEAQSLDPIRATLDGREVRCATCGGHLGDLFNDGWVYVGSSAAKTGNRYCIDGAALVFKPADGGEEVFGDTPPPNRVIMYEPSLYR